MCTNAAVDLREKGETFGLCFSFRCKIGYTEAVPRTP